PLRCLMFAHFECPAMSYLDQIQQHLVDAGVVREFGMKRGSEDGTLPHHHGMVVDPGEHVHRAAHLRHPRRPDEDGMEWAIEAGDVDVALEGVVLAAEG